jgi:flavin-dependent thymidylate synthase
MPTFDPIVQLIDAPRKTFQTGVAAAKTCYAKDFVTPDEVDHVGEDFSKGIYQAGHHTVNQHANFTFAISGVSRHFVWSFLHTHPFYNSSQQSQRYVDAGVVGYVTPSMSDKAAAIYKSTVEEMILCYYQLCDLLFQPACEEYFKRFPARKKNERDWYSQTSKIAMENARYVLPICMTTRLYHTVDATTLMRYWHLRNTGDAKEEQDIVATKMVQAVCNSEPKYRALLSCNLEYPDYPEEYHRRFGSTEKYIRSFDMALGGRMSRLFTYTNDAAYVTATAVRDVLGLFPSEMSDQMALEHALNPAYSPALAETLRPTRQTKLGACLTHAHFTFAKRLSHTADSQNQRHRMVSASRPLLSNYIGSQPDCTMPKMIAKHSKARDVFEHAMEVSWHCANILNNEEGFVYILPNALNIRMTETGSLADLQHKYATRLCLNAQDEIREASMQEVEQIGEVFPEIAKFLAPSCVLRNMAGMDPYCNEGQRFCGRSVWNQKTV